jgi:hypothetical protein
LYLEPLEDRTLPSAGWAISPGGTGTFDLDQHISQPDANGNVYVTSYFSGTVTFPTPNGTTTLTTPSNNFASYVAKVDPNGNFLWAEQFGGQRSGAWSGVTVDTSGNVYLTGDFNGTQSFGSFSLTGTSANGTGYLCKVDPNGNFLWAQEFAYGTSGSHSGFLTPLAVDGNGNAYLSWFANSPTGSVGFLSKYDSSGSLQWTQQVASGATACSPNCVTLDANGNAYVGGNATQGNSGGFLASYDPTGKLYWSETTASPVRADAIYQNTLYTGMAPNANSPTDFQKYDLSGNVLLSEQITSPVSVTPFGMAVDTSGNVYLTGGFGQDTDFDPGPGVAVMDTGGSFVVKLDSSGNFLSAWNVGGASYGMALDSSGDIYTVGHFSGTTNFDTGSQIVSLTSSSSQGLYIVKTTHDTGMIFGQVFNDLNNNGVLDAGSLESGIPNVTVYLDLNNSGSYVAGDPTAVTDSQGYYHFADVAPGTYTLRQVVPSGYTATPASIPVSVSAGLASETTVIADYTPNKTRTYSNTTPVRTSHGKPNAVSSLTVPDSYTVLGMTLGLTVSNSSHQNLTIFLTGPDGTKVSLGSTTQTGALSFLVPYFDYKAVKGTWKLEVDGLAGGTLSSWSLGIDGTMS